MRVGVASKPPASALAAATASACSVDEGPQTSCTRQDGSDPSWALRCCGPSAESLVDLGDGPFDAPSYVAVFDGEGELV